MNRSLILVALSATYTSAGSTFILNDTRDAGPLNDVRSLKIDDGSDTNDGAGGTEQVKKTDSVDANVISSVDAGANGGAEQVQQQAQAEIVAGGGEQMQAQASDTSQVSGELNDKKIDDSAGTGQVKAIGDPPADASSQLG